MVERSAVVICLFLVVLAAALVVRAVARRRAAAAERQRLPDELRMRFPSGGPGILYFFGPHCGPCVRQGAILESLSGEDQVTVVRVDATRETGAAAALGVMTVPTTVIVDAACRVRVVNPGLRSRDMLAAQLRDLTGSPVAEPHPSRR